MAARPCAAYYYDAMTRCVCAPDGADHRTDRRCPGRAAAAAAAAY
jgi:hypothetical protein